MGSDATSPGKKRRVKFRLELTGRGSPQAPPSPVEVSTQFADEGGLLELVPQSTLFTRHIGDSGDIERVPDTWLTRWVFRVSINGSVITLEQVADKYGHKLPFGLFAPPDGQHLNGHTLFHLEAGKPMTIYLNVPGGGPQWTLALMGIE